MYLFNLTKIALMLTLLLFLHSTLIGINCPNANASRGILMLILHNPTLLLQKFKKLFSSSIFIGLNNSDRSCRLSSLTIVIGTQVFSTNSYELSKHASTLYWMLPFCVVSVSGRRCGSVHAKLKAKIPAGISISVALFDPTKYVFECR